MELSVWKHSSVEEQDEDLGERQRCDVEDESGIDSVEALSLVAPASCGELKS